MPCVDCPQADKHHSEMKALAKRLTDAIREFEHGHMMTAIEEMELVVIHLEAIHKQRMER